MKLVTFTHNGFERVGALVHEQVIDLNFACSLFLEQRSELNPSILAQALVPPNMNQFLEKGIEALAYAQQSISFLQSNDITFGNNGEKIVYPINEIKLNAVTPRPGKIICIGLNYQDHCEETGMDIPKSPIIFPKYNNAIIGNGDDVILPMNSNEVDYEAELAFVIGKKANKINKDEAMNYVAGYTILNDISARDIQFHDGQWLRGKSPDTFAPIGPILVTRDEIDNPHGLDISLKLNEEIMQQSNTKNLIFDIPDIIYFLTQSMTLKPGDIVATGTPPGVGMSREPKVWLKQGDEMVIEVEKIGSLYNNVTVEK